MEFWRLGVLSKISNEIKDQREAKKSYESKEKLNLRADSRVG